MERRNLALALRGHGLFFVDLVLGYYFGLFNLRIEVLNSLDHDHDPRVIRIDSRI